MNNVLHLFPEQPAAQASRFEELWEPVPGMPYEASDRGRIRRTTGGHGAVAGRVLRPAYDTKGYLNVMIRPEVGVKKYIGVHRLVCMAFHGAPPFDGAQAAHCDGNKINNVPGNLRWASPKENASDRLVHGTHNRGERSPRTRLTAADVVHIRREIHGAPRGGKMAAAIRLADHYGMSKWSIYELSRDRKNWRWLKTGLPRAS